MVRPEHWCVVMHGRMPYSGILHAVPTMWRSLSLTLRRLARLIGLHQKLIAGTSRSPNYQGKASTLGNTLEFCLKAGLPESIREKRKENLQLASKPEICIFYIGVCLWGFHTGYMSCTNQLVWNNSPCKSHPPCEYTYQTHVWLPPSKPVSLLLASYQVVTTGNEQSASPAPLTAKTLEE